MKLGLRQANQHFAKAMKVVKAGREVVLTDRGQPIAVIKPLPEGLGGEARLAAMEGEGLIVRAERPGPMPPPRWRPIPVKGRPLSAAVAEDREEGA